MSNIFDYNYNSITPYPYWRWNKVLPAVYDDSLSQYELLSKLLYTVNTIITSTNDMGTQVEQLTQLVQQLIDGQFPQGLIDYVSDIARAAVADDIDAINAIIAQIQADIAELDSEATMKVSKLNDSSKLLVVIGDSWNAGACDGHLQNYDISDGWGAQLAEIVGRDTTRNFGNYAQPSAGFFKKGGSPARNFYDMVNELNGSENCTAVIVGGGINDSTAVDSNTISLSEVVTGARSFCNLCASKYPNAIIYVFPMLWSGHSKPREADIRTKEAIIRGCRTSNAMVSICEHTPEFLYGQAAYFGSETQGHHTTADGLNQVAHYMANFINGGDSHFCYYTPIHDTSQHDCLDYSRATVRISDGMLTVRIYGKVNSNYDITPRTFYTLPAGNRYFMDLYDNHVLCPISGNQAPVMSTVQGSTITLGSNSGSTITIGTTNVFIDFTMPFAF